MLFIRIGNVIVALMYVLGQLLEMFIGREGLLFALYFPLSCIRQVFCSVDATMEDELVVGADLLFLDGEEICASGIGVRIVLGVGSNKCMTMCFMSSNSCS